MAIEIMLQWAILYDDAIASGDDSLQAFIGGIEDDIPPVRLITR